MKYQSVIPLKCISEIAETLPLEGIWILKGRAQDLWDNTSNIGLNCHFPLRSCREKLCWSGFVICKEILARDEPV